MYCSRIELLRKESADVFQNYLKNETDEITNDLKDNEYMKTVYEKIPIVKVQISFTDAKTEYQKQLLKDWINLTGEEEICFEVEYSFAPAKSREFTERIRENNSVFQCIYLERHRRQIKK